MLDVSLFIKIYIALKQYKNKNRASLKYVLCGEKKTHIIAQ